MAQSGDSGDQGKLHGDHAGDAAPAVTTHATVPGKQSRIERELVGTNAPTTGKVGQQSLIEKEHGRHGKPTAGGTHQAASSGARPDPGQTATRSDLLILEPPTIRFGRVPLRAKGQTEAAPYEITASNPTGDTITIDEMRADADADFPIFSGDTTDTAIPPGGTFRFRVGFRPHRLGPQTSTVHLIQRGVSVGRVQVEATVLDEHDHWESLAVSPQSVNFKGVAIGEESPPHKLKVTNASGVPVRLEDLAPVAGAVDQFRIYGASNDEIPAGAATELSIGFRPTLLHAQDASFQIRTAGDTATGKDLDLRHGKVTARGVGLDAVDARHDAALAGGPIGAVNTYAQMLASLQAAQQFTDAGSAKDYSHAAQLLGPVAARLDELAPRVREFAGTMGFSSTNVLLVFGYAHDDVNIWKRLLRPTGDGDGTPTINAAPYVTAFEDAKEVLQVVTGEEKDAPNLRALGRAAKWTPVAIAGATVGGAALATGGAEAAPLVTQAWPTISTTLASEWSNARWAFAAVSTWVLSHPEEVHDLTLYLTNVGISIVDAGGLSHWLDQLGDFPEGTLNAIGQVAEGMLIGSSSNSASEPDAATGTEPTPGARARPASDEPEPEPSPSRGGRGTHAPDEPDAAAPRSPHPDEPATSGQPSPAAKRFADTVIARLRGVRDRVVGIADRARAEAPLVAEGAPLPSVRTPRALRERAVEVRAQVDAALDHAGAPGGSYRVEVLDERAYAKKFGADRGPAAMVIEHDQPTVYASTSATEADLAHEATHIAQLRDSTNPKVQESIRILGDETLSPSKWKQADPGLRKELYERKLEVEIDAATRELNTAEGEARVKLEQDLAELQRQQATVQAITDEQLLKMKARVAPLPDFLEDPSFLFARARAVVDGRKMPSPYHYEEKGDYKRTPVTDSPAAKNGAKVEQVGETWTEAIVVTSSYKGRATVERQGDAAIVYVDEPSGARRRYVGEADAKLAVATGDEVEPGTPLMHERSKKYRMVDADGELRVEELIKRGRWQLAGEHARNRGLVTEDAARAQVDAELEAEMQKPPDRRRDHLAGFVRLDNQTGSGAGFDDVVVEFHGEPPTALVRIVETKDYPNRSVPIEDMTAIRNNLAANRNRLVAEVAEAAKVAPEDRAPQFQRLSEPQLDAIRDALRENNVQIELRLGPTTRVSQPTLDKLRVELAAAFGGKDVLAKTPTAVGQEFIDDAARKRFPSPHDQARHREQQP